MKEKLHIRKPLQRRIYLYIIFDVKLKYFFILQQSENKKIKKQENIYKIYDSLYAHRGGGVV